MNELNNGSYIWNTSYVNKRGDEYAAVDAVSEYIDPIDGAYRIKLSFGGTLVPLKQWGPLWNVKESITKVNLHERLIWKVIYYKGSSGAKDIAKMLKVPVKSISSILAQDRKKSKKHISIVYNPKVGAYIYTYVGPAYYWLANGPKQYWESDENESTIIWSVLKTIATINIMSDDLNLVKMTHKDQNFVLGCKKCFERSGALTGKQIMVLSKIYFKYL